MQQPISNTRMDILFRIEVDDCLPGVESDIVQKAADDVVPILKVFLAGRLELPITVTHVMPPHALDGLPIDLPLFGLLTAS